MTQERRLECLSDDELLGNLGDLLRQSRRVESALVAHIGEVDQRRLYAREASPSMFAFCTQVLHLSEAEAYLRIEVARASRKHPVLLEMLSDGRLHLSGIAKLAPHLTEHNRDSLLVRAAGKSKRQIEELKKVNAVLQKHSEEQEGRLKEMTGQIGQLTKEIPSSLTAQAAQLGGDPLGGAAHRLAPLRLVEAVEPNLDDVFVLAAVTAGERAAAARVDPDARTFASGTIGGFNVDALSIRFGRVTAVDAVSFDARPGELLALLGPNGAGKTTLIRALCGLLAPSSGGGKVAGVALGRDPAALRQRIGYMSQHFSLYLDLTPAENLQFFAAAYGLAGAAARRAIAVRSAGPSSTTSSASSSRARSSPSTRRPRSCTA